MIVVITQVLTIALVLGGVFFLAVSCIGLIRLPDFYSRTHAASKSETLGAMLILGGLILHHGVAFSSFKLLLILVFVAVASPTATHAISRAALSSGVPIWSRRQRAGDEV